MSGETSQKEYSTNKHLYSFCVNPRVTFETQEPEEKVILLVRQHPLNYLSKIITVGILVLLPPFLDAILMSYISIQQVLVFNILWYGGLSFYALINILLWTFNCGIVTNLRIIDVDYSSIFNKEISMSSLREITDVTGHSTGFVQSMFGYGDVFVQTAGIKQNIEFMKVPEPAVIVSMINKLIRKT